MASKLDREAKELADKINPKACTAFGAGQYLHELSNRVYHGDEARFKEIVKTANIKGRNWAKCCSFLKLYRLYGLQNDYSLETMNSLNDQIASILGEKLHKGKVPRNGKIDEQSLYVSRNKALEIALNPACSSQKLEAFIRSKGTIDIGAFEDERSFQDWFCIQGAHPQLGITVKYPQAAPGPATRDIDAVATKEDKSEDVILIELKDVADYNSVGQVLAQRNELLKYKKGETVFLYTSSKISQNKFDKVPVSLNYKHMESWLVSQVFLPSAYFAAKDQDIHLVRIKNNKDWVGPKHAQNMTPSEWIDFGGAPFRLGTDIATEEDED